VELTQHNITLQMRVFIEQLRVDSTSKIFNILPLHHADGILAGVTLAFFAGATLHRPGRFSLHDLPNLMDYIYREGITHMITVPTVLALMQRLGDDYTETFQSGDFKVLVSSAGFLATDLWRSFEERFKVRVSNGYGLTETVSMFSFCGPADNTFRIGSVGMPVVSEIRIVDDSGATLSPGAEGELLVRSELVMKGYINNPQASADAVADGWFRTGDIARIAPDGKLEILGRKKSIIIHGGINIHPEEIIDAALEHHGVVHAAVFGEPDEIWGEVAVLCIVDDPAASPSEEELQTFLRNRLACEKIPSEIHRFPDFPRGPAGKAVLHELREQVALRKETRNFSDEGDPFEVIVGIGAALLKMPRESLSHSSSADTVKGWDSLLHLSFIMAVERTYGVQFLPREIMAVRSVGDLVALAEKYRRDKKAPT
jgi:long-chain acyl-CoA synthetase